MIGNIFHYIYSRGGNGETSACLPLGHEGTDFPRAAPANNTTSSSHTQRQEEEEALWRDPQSPPLQNWKQSPPNTGTRGGTRNTTGRRRHSNTPRTIATELEHIVNTPASTTPTPTSTTPAPIPEHVQFDGESWTTQLPKFDRPLNQKDLQQPTERYQDPSTVAAISPWWNIAM